MNEEGRHPEENLYHRLLTLPTNGLSPDAAPGGVPTMPARGEKTRPTNDAVQR